MSSKLKAVFYYDIISPFAYLFMKACASLGDRVNLIPKPIFLPGLLRLQNNRGPAEIPAKREQLGLHANTESPQDEAIKAALADATQQASEAGIFGVPSVCIDGHVFWGLDTIDWVHEYLDDPDLFKDSAYQRAVQTENPLLSKR